MNDGKINDYLYKSLFCGQIYHIINDIGPAKCNWYYYD